jgi:hypothetical protein
MREEAHIVGISYNVLDAWLFEYFLRLNINPEVTREFFTSGSNQYILTLGDTELLRIRLLTLDTQRTIIIGYVSDDRVGASLADVIDRFRDWYKRQMQPADTATERAIVANRGKPGPQRLKVNEWAREQARQGKTIDEILPEYARRRRMKTSEARELLRKALD